MGFIILDQMFAAWVKSGQLKKWIPLKTDRGDVLNKSFCFNFCSALCYLKYSTFLLCGGINGVSEWTISLMN